ncbi:hypothetical protein [Amycolatopsis keratiniphila]|uniref:Uncharacterized protein n=1 Tax=Amycolatopsis keratiniphila TaxID=129921 RepID=R4SUS6_9PSEU|nr:hypothetical protein [Amycolatopsis keratiniphila]AGM07129.1 hypothetical protein AORI_4545 [Amycolatopsis keratiniphila]
MPWLLPDGSDVFQLIDDGHTERLGFVPRFVHANHGTRLGDLLWTTGDTKIASRRFLEVLASIEATGYRTFPVDVVDREGRALGDFVGLAIEDGDPGKDLHFSHGAQFWAFAASGRVVDALTRAGVTDLSITPRRETQQDTTGP